MLLSILINEVTAQGMPFVLILDDFHVIQAESILEMLAFLLDHVPPQLHLLIITRVDPPLPLFRLRARDQLLEIRAEQLRFSKQETTIFLNDVMRLKLPADAILAILARTEGRNRPVCAGPFVSPERFWWLRHLSCRDGRIRSGNIHLRARADKGTSCSATRTDRPGSF